MTAAVRDSSTHDSAKSPAAPLVPLRARARSGPIAPHLHRLPIVCIRGNPVFWMGIIKRQMGPLLRLWRASDAVGACRSFLLVISALSVLVSGEKKKENLPGSLHPSPSNRYFFCFFSLFLDSSFCPSDTLTGREKGKENSCCCATHTAPVGPTLNKSPPCNTALALMERRENKRSGGIEK